MTEIDLKAAAETASAIEKRLSYLGREEELNLARAYLTLSAKMKPVEAGPLYEGDEPECPKCRECFSGMFNYCPSCGQALKWL